MRILITGASGFIGRNLAGYLKKNLVDAEIVCFVRSEDKFLINIGCKLIVGDISQLNLPIDEKFDVVVHLAQSRHYREFPEEAVDIYSVNVNSTFLLAEWSRLTGVKQFIFASTGSVYEPTGNILSESANVNPSNFYAASKLAAEALLKPFAVYFNISVLRLFSPYGPEQKNMLIPNLVNNIKSGKKISLSGKEGLILSPLYIDDCAELIYRLMMKQKTGYEIYNLGGNEIISLKEIALTIGHQLNMDVDMETDESKQVVNISADSSKLFTLLGSIPKIKFSEGLKKYLS